jgi:hypothetical protein
VLVAFASTGFMPKRIRTGKVMSVPPPATALIIPAAQEAANMETVSIQDIY